LVLGAFSVDVPTLNRFFALHYLFPFILSGLIFLHLFFLHEVKSGEPLGLSSVNVDGIPFGIYYIIKDFYGFIYYFFLLFFLVFFFPNLLGHSDNYIVANAMVTPAHIVPEWYFLPFYAILRSITDKLKGVILMLVSIFILILFPMVFNNIFITSFVSASGLFRPYYEKIVQIFFCSAIILGWIGGNSAIEPYIQIGFIAMIVYFTALTYGIYLATVAEFFFFKSTNLYLEESKDSILDDPFAVHTVKQKFFMWRLPFRSAFRVTVIYL
jgi:ubiquinol-cytochrome c reductase cytochrome b subunit